VGAPRYPNSIRTSSSFAELAPFSDTNVARYCNHCPDSAGGVIAAPDCSYVPVHAAAASVWNEANKKKKRRANALRFFQ